MVSHKGTLERGSQAYSLVISGAGGTAYCASAPTATSGTKLDSVSINNIQFVNSASKDYVDNTNFIITAEPQGSLNYYIRTNSVDATNANRFIKVFIDLNLASSNNVVVEIYTIDGQLIRNFAEKNILIAKYELNFTSEATGVYFAKIKAGDVTLTKRIVVTK